MNTNTSHTTWRAVCDTACAVTVALVFVLAWALQNIPDGARRLTTFGASILFVVFLQEAVRSWRRARVDRDRIDHPIQRVERAGTRVQSVSDPDSNAGIRITTGRP